MIYVDSLIEYNVFGHKLWCHLLADTEDELHIFAKRLGLKKEWCQKSGKRDVHYDLTENKRRLAIKLGASEDYKEFFHKLWERDKK
jgi:hypothetical protein